MKFIAAALISSTTALPTAAADYLTTPTVQQTSPWSGSYIGVSGGVGSGTLNFTTDAAPGQLSSSIGGLEAVIRAGYDYSQESFLAGFVADYSISNIGLTGNVTIPDIASTEAEYRLTGLGTLRARVGVIQHNNLFYAHAGAAIATMSISADGNDVAGVIDNPRFGFVGGVGHEYAVAEHATIQTEYSYVHLGEFDVFTGAGATLTDQLSFHKISTGLNFRF